MAFAIPNFLQPLLVRPAAILGGGVSGEAARALLAALGVEGKIYDAKTEAFTREAAQAHGLVIHSPGFAPQHPWLVGAREAGCVCLGELDFASFFWRGRVVAITGTNGKTTLTEFLVHGLRTAGRAAYATGNIGYPFCRLILDLDGGSPEVMAVCEVSSFQAEALRHLCADALLWTNFAEDHLERHPGMAAYFQAKAVLCARTDTRHVYFGSSVAAYATQAGCDLQGTAVPSEGRAADASLAQTIFATYPQRENYLLAEAWWQAEGLAVALLQEAARSFQLGRHRLAEIGTWDGVTFWNDSKATNFHAAEAALARFPEPVILIAGGKGKGGDLGGFVRRIASRVKHVFLIGETKAVLAEFCVACRIAHTLCQTLEEAVLKAVALAVSGDVVLLSPGFASLDMFRSYEDRGERFERQVRATVKNPTLK